MIDRKKYDNLIETLEKIAQHHTDHDLHGTIAKICALRDGFEFKLMVVGPYNAGKSSLLNGLIERMDFLKVAQVPQTALATELTYAEQESAFAVRRSGENEKLSDNEEYTSTEYRNLIYQLPAEGLRRLSDYTVVDMPGLDSGLEAHARALQGYIGTGSAYLIVLDQEKGGIDESTLNFLGEVSAYSDQIAVLINKCDKITEKTAQSIAEATQNMLRSYGYPFPVYTVSARAEDIRDRLVSVASEFRMQAVFDRAMQKCIYSEMFQTVKSLQIIKRRLFLDTYDLDCAIDNYKRTRYKLSQAFAKQQKKNLQSIDENTSHIVSELRSALLRRSDAIAYALLGENQTAAEAIVLETIRPVMLSCIRDISLQQIDDATAALDFSGLESKEEQKDVSEIVCNIADNFKNLIDEGCFERRRSPSDEKKKKMKKEYQAVTGLLAIATDFIVPWMELVIVFLPDIISLLGKLLGESELDHVKHNFENNVVPQICNKLFSQVRTGLESTTKRVLNEYKVELERQLEALQDSVEKAKQDRQHRETDYKQKNEMLEQDIGTLQALMKKVEEL